MPRRPYNRTISPSTWVGRRATVNAKYDTGRATSARRYRSYSSVTAEFAEATAATRIEISESLSALDRQNSVIKRILNAAIEHIIGRGPRVVPATADPGYNAAALAWYNRRGSRYNYSVTRELSRHQAACLGLRHKLRNGGVLIYHPFGRVQLFEDGQIVTPRNRLGDTRVKDGIQYSSRGALEAYFVGPYTKYGVVDSANAFRLPAWKTDPRLPEPLPLTTYAARISFLSGRRGVSDLCPAIDHVERNEEFWEARLERAIQDSCVGGVVFTKNITAARAGLSVGRQDDSGSTDGQDTYDLPAYTEPGTIFALGDEDKYQQTGTPTPNGNEEAFSKAAIRLASIVFAMPIEVVLIAFERNFSASLGAMEIFKKWARQQQLEWTHEFYWPDYLFSIYEAIELGELPWRDDWHQVTIEPDGWEALDKRGEATANQYRLGSGTANLTNILAEQGRAIEEHLRQRAMEISLADRIAKEYGISRRDLLPYLGQTTAGALIPDDPQEPDQ